jgi:hypothetical protein
MQQIAQKAYFIFGVFAHQKHSSCMITKHDKLKQTAKTTVTSASLQSEPIYF